MGWMVDGARYCAGTHTVGRRFGGKDECRVRHVGGDGHAAGTQEPFRMPLRSSDDSVLLDSQDPPS